MGRLTTKKHARVSYLVAAFAVNSHDEAYAARFFFQLRIVQTVLSGTGPRVLFLRLLFLRLLALVFILSPLGHICAGLKHDGSEHDRLRTVSTVNASRTTTRTKRYRHIGIILCRRYGGSRVRALTYLYSLRARTVRDGGEHVRRVTSTADESINRRLGKNGFSVSGETTTWSRVWYGRCILLTSRVFIRPIITYGTRWRGRYILWRRLQYCGTKTQRHDGRLIRQCNNMARTATTKRNCTNEKLNTTSVCTRLNADRVLWCRVVVFVRGVNSLSPPPRTMVLPIWYESAPCVRRPLKSTGRRWRLERARARFGHSAILFHRAASVALTPGPQLSGGFSLVFSLRSRDDRDVAMSHTHGSKVTLSSARACSSEYTTPVRCGFASSAIYFAIFLARNIIPIYYVFHHWRARRVFVQYYPDK